MSRRARKLFAGILTLAMVLTSITWPKTGSKVSAEDSLQLDQSEEIAAVEKYNSTDEAALSVNEDIISITGTELNAIGINVSNLISTKTSVYPYVQVTKAHDRSRIVFSCLNTDASSNSSNKGIIGIKTDYDPKSDGSAGTDFNGATREKFVIHCGYGTGKAGTGIGAAGTGYYGAFPSLDTSKWSGKTAENISLRLQVRTKETECKLLGVVFGDNQSFTVKEDGSIEKGFDTSKLKLESQTPDSTDVKPKSEAELKSEAEKELSAQINKAKQIGKDDCLSDSLYQALQKAITEAQAVLDNADATSAELNAAIGNLKTALVNATGSEAAVGLMKAIDYCKSLKEGDYTSDSFAKLAPAITTAEAVFANYSSKSNSELKNARDALEAVRVALVPKMSNDPGNPKDFRILSKKDVIADMGAGINLGNTMEGGLINATETSWQAAKTTKKYIKALHDAGYNTLRIPVTWNGYINNDYSIKETWINRVQEIVDYCIEQDMYAIINIHHDGAANHDNRGDNPECWLDTYEWDIEQVYQKFQGVWNTIANRFKDYDEHLIFESMNEVTDAHGTATNEDTAVLNALNQLFVNTVRATGSNNTKRWLAITGRFATFSTGTTMPADTLADKGEVGTTRLMFAVHIYKASTSVRRTNSELRQYQTSLSSTVNNVNGLSKDMPIYIGEYGQQQKKQDGSATGMNNAERALDGEFVNGVAKFYGVCPVVWDQGWGSYGSAIKTDTGGFTYWNRVTCEPVYKDLVEGMMRGSYADMTYYNPGSTVATLMDGIYKSYGHSSTSDNSVSKDPTVASAKDITLSSTTVTLKAGERKTVTGTSDSVQDVVLWSTDDDTVATVSQGNIHAKRAGITTVHAYTQSGSVEKDIKVIVSPNGKETATAISTDKAYYSVTKGKTATINATLTPADSQDEVSYFSSNTAVATVSSRGVVTGENTGTAFIIVTAASGVSTIAKFTVTRDTVRKNEATAMTTSDENIIKMAEPGETKEITLSLTPADTDSKAALYSTNASVVDVDSTARAVDEDGNVKVTLTAGSTGSAIVVAITENLRKVFYAVGVGDVEVSEPTDPTPDGMDGSTSNNPSTPGDDNPGGNTGGDNTGGDNPGGNTGGDNPGGNTGGDNPGGNTGGDNPGGNTGGDNPGGNTGGDNNGDDGTGDDGTGDNGTGGSGTGGNGTGGNETTTLTVSNNSVIIAAGKTASVNFTASSTPSVKTSNAKVATAKVSDNKVLISVPKNATKGVAAKITLTVGTKSAAVNVTVQNPAKKIKAAKKTLTVKAKKSVTAKFKVTATNKKKAAADTIIVTSKKTKIAKVVSYSVKKGKATVKIQGVKKGKTTVTLKIGKKSAKVNVKVK